MKARLQLLLACVAYCQAAVAAGTSAQRRRTIGRALSFIGAGAFLLWTMLVLVPEPAFAGVIDDIKSLLTGSFNTDPNSVQSELMQSVDPTAAIQSATSSWFGKAQTLAQDTYGLLLVIELFMFGLQAILFKDDVGAFLASAAFKVFTIGFFVYLISQADTIFKMIRDSFDQAGQAIGSAGGGKTGASGVAAFAILVLGLAALFFAVGFMGQQIDKSNAEACGMLNVNVTGTVEGNLSGNVSGTAPEVSGNVNGTVGSADDMHGSGTGNLGCATATPFDHLLYDVTCFGMAFMLASSVAIIILTYIMITVESYIVMTAGVFFLGFAGSRFTMPFSQGYLAYAVNVGVKMFTFWLVIALENAMLQNLIRDAAGALFFAVTTAALSAAGGGGLGTTASYITCALALAAGAVSVFQAMIMSVLAYSIPQMAGNFISGRSTLSGAQALSGTISTIEGAIGTVANARQMMQITNDGAKIAAQREAGKSAGQMGREVSAPMAPSRGTWGVGRALPMSSDYASVPTIPLHGSSMGGGGNTIAPSGGGASAGGGTDAGVGAGAGAGAGAASGGGTGPTGWESPYANQASNRQDDIDRRNDVLYNADSGFDPIFGTMLNNGPVPSGGQGGGPNLTDLSADQLAALSVGRGLPPNMPPGAAAEYFRQLLVKLPNNGDVGFLMGRPDLRRVIADTQYGARGMLTPDGKVDLHAQNLFNVLRAHVNDKVADRQVRASSEAAQVAIWANKVVGAFKEGQGPSVQIRLGMPDQL